MIDATTTEGKMRFAPLPSQIFILCIKYAVNIEQCKQISDPVSHKSAVTFAFHKTIVFDWKKKQKKKRGKT